MTAPFAHDPIDDAAPGETVLLAYAVVRASAPVAAVGIDGAEVDLVGVDQLAAAVTPVASHRPLTRRADLLAYGNVVDALAEHGPVAPLRYGTMLPDRQAVVDQLTPRIAGLTALLDHLDGKRQYNLRAAYREDVVLAELVAADPEIRRLREWTRELPADAGHRERLELGERVAAALQARSEDDAALLLDVALHHAVEHRVRTPPSSTQVLDAALLVDDERADDLLLALEDLAAGVHPQLRLTLVGPVAPYDFVTETAWD